MKITFGQALDGVELRGVKNSMDSMVCGPLRLMEILELQLGLKRKSIGDLARVFRFVKVLQTLVEKSQHFYSASFQKDPLSVSEALLHWRDSLVLAGWKGATNGGLKRLEDLAEINAALKDSHILGESDRLVAIRDSLADRKHRVHDIIVVDPPTSFPRLCAA